MKAQNTSGRQQPHLRRKSTDPAVKVREFSVDGISCQLIGIRVRTAWHLPEAYLNAKIVNLITEVVKLLNKVVVGNGKTTGIDVSIVAPLDDPVGHAVDDVR